MITQIQTDLYRQRLGDVLAGQGFLGARALARLARRLLESPSRRAGEILIEEGFANGELVTAGLRRQLRHKLDALFQIKDAQLAFRIPRPHDAHQVPLAPGEFLHGRPRARPRARAAETPPPRASQSSSGAGRAGASQPAAHGARSRAYATLGLLPGADRSAVQQAFRRLALRLHPDRFPNADPSERARLLSRFAELSAAYHALAG
jgi:hypothetical protein